MRYKITTYLFRMFGHESRIHEELKRALCLSNHFSPCRCGSLQLQRWPPCLTPPDSEPSITAGCGNHPQGGALTDSQDVCCVAAAGLPRPFSLDIHVLQESTGSEVNMAAGDSPCKKTDSFQSLHKNTKRTAPKTEPRGAFRVCSGFSLFAHHYLVLTKGLKHVCLLVYGPHLLWSDACSAL